MVETQQPESTLQTLADMRTNGSRDGQLDIAQLFRVPERYLRSVHIERDFDDPTSLNHYVMTPPMQALFSRIVAGLQPGSANRAWRVTGDYGTGKSSFALVLAHLLRDPTSHIVEAIRQAIEEESKPGALEGVHVLPVLVTGAREPLVPAVARALIHSLERLRGRKRMTREIERLRAQAAAVSHSADHSELLDLLSRVSFYAATQGWTGVFLVLDELGKFLEYAALRPDREDVYILQRLAESASRSGENPLVILGLLHQGFHAYAETLPSTTRQEWEKVADRYSEITFNQPLSHVTALVTEALNIDRSLVPSAVNEAIHAVQAATVRTGWFGAPEKAPSTLALYPLHPTVLPVLVRFFARFGQHERSLFSFLLSSEPFGLQSFADRPANGHTWYRLPDFYDYIRSAFGYRLGASSYRGHWLRLTETIDTVGDLDALQLAVLKTVAVLNVLDAEHLLAKETVLSAALTDGDETGAVGDAVESLESRGLLFNRGTAGGYSLWPSTSVNLVSAFEAARRALGPMDRVAPRVRPYLGQSSVVARRHYIEWGTLRYFEIRYADSATLLETLEQPTEADGLVVVALCDTASEVRDIRASVTASEIATHGETIVAVPPSLQGVAAQVLDAQCWQWVADNTPALEQDSYAAAEVARQIAASRRVLLRSLDSLMGFRGESPSEVEWWHRGRLIELPVKGKLSALLSNVCDELYYDAPRIRNELLNRRTLSSAASAARQRLIERMFASSGEPYLGLDEGKAPPEKSMYLSVLEVGNVHREVRGHFVLTEPPKDADPLHIRPALMRIVALLEQADGRRVPVTEIFEVLQGRPYGVRAGVTPLLLAIAFVAHSHEIAMYENGTFLQKFDSPDFVRLTKQPSTFEMQLCRVAGVRMEVFLLLVSTFAQERRNDRDHELLDVVRPLSIFAAQLPEYTRRNTNLEDPAKSVLDALLKAREPATLVFETLPVACGLEPFPIGGSIDHGRARKFVAALQDATLSLRATYPKLLERIRVKIMLGLGDGSICPDRAQVMQRSSRIVVAAVEPRLQAFARCLADSELTDDLWAERVASFVASKPPAQWTAADEYRALNELDILTGVYCRVEATIFDGDDSELHINAIRLGVTRGDGSEFAKIVRFRSEDEVAVRELAVAVQSVLAEARSLKLAAIARALWDIIGDDVRVTGGAPGAEDEAGGDSTRGSP